MTSFILFIEICKRRRLDPFSRQIYLTKRRNKDGGYDLAFVTSIDALRLIAQRSGCCAGIDDVVFSGRVRIGDIEAPAVAASTVNKLVGGQRCAFAASARWSEFYPEGRSGFLWRKMPHVMLGKVAEAAALRKAFPQDLSGLYSPEEMDQADRHVTASPAAPRTDRRVVEQLADLAAKWKSVHPDHAGDRGVRFSHGLRAVLGMDAQTLSTPSGWTIDAVETCRRALEQGDAQATTNSDELPTGSRESAWRQCELAHVDESEREAAWAEAVRAVAGDRIEDEITPDEWAVIEGSFLPF